MNEIVTALPGNLPRLFAKSGSVVREETGTHVREGDSLVRTRTMHVFRLYRPFKNSAWAKALLQRIIEDVDAGHAPLAGHRWLAYFLFLEPRVIDEELVQTDQDGDLKIYDRTRRIGYLMPFLWHAHGRGRIAGTMAELAIGVVFGLIIGMPLALIAFVMVTVTLR